jgi:hypothetical protein
MRAVGVRCVWNIVTSVSGIPGLHHLGRGGPHNSYSGELRARQACVANPGPMNTEFNSWVLTFSCSEGMHIHGPRSDPVIRQRPDCLCTGRGHREFTHGA